MNTRGENPLLAVSDMSKRFGATQALLDVSFEVSPGEVHALMGENGAGKSTLMKIIAGIYAPDSGDIFVNGTKREFRNPRDAMDAGVAIIHQELSTVPDMTVSENLALGSEPTKMLGILDRRQVVEDARRKLELVGADIDPRRRIGSLSVGMQQLVEIARAVSENAKVVVFDEPTAALSQGESEKLFELIEKMRSEGIGLVYISHRMEEVYRLADRITVLRDGAYVGTRAKADASPNEIVHMMVGREIADVQAKSRGLVGDVRLSVRAITSDDGEIGPVSFDVRAGEVVAMVGLVGAGRTETARLIYGAQKMASGTILVDGQPFTPKRPRNCISKGIAMLPEDRKDQALFLKMAVTDNVGISTLARWTAGPVLRGKKMAKGVSEITARLKLKSASGDSAVSSLSGGNQQKVVFARLMSQRPRVIMLDEPTRGVDIGAKNEIYQIIDELASDRAAVLMVTSDLPEALRISDRLLVMREGRIVADIPIETASEEIVMEYATGIAAPQNLEAEVTA